MKARWKQLCERIGAFGKADEADITFDMIQTLYSHPPRAYHNLDHIAQCLGMFDEVRMLADDKDGVEFALWMHDSVFVAERPDNEARSADAAGMVAGLLGCRPGFAERARDYIAVTRHSVVPGRGDPALVADIDLSILGAPWPAYDAYRRAIREEFSFAGDEMFRHGRTAFLERMLSRDRIYTTQLFEKSHEHPSRDNMQRELDLLREGIL